jgi:hypothetical protein
MEEDSDDSETQPLYPRSTRQSCFMCKRSLEDKPYTNYALKLFLGLVQLLHIWTSLALLYLKLEYFKGSYSLIITPLIVLTAELFLACIVMLFIIFNDLFYRRIRGITLWQRQAIGRLVRNIIILVLIEITLLSFYFNSDQNELKIQKSLLPVLILTVIVFFRYLLIVSEYSLLFLTVSSLLLSQQILLILKLEYQIDIIWKYTLIPTIALCYILVLLTIYLIWEQINDFFKVIIAFFSFAGSVLFSIGITVGILQEFNASLYIYIIISLVFISIGIIEKLGSFIIDITIGHIDIDILDLKHPIQTLSNAPHSV